MKLTYTIEIDSDAIGKPYIEDGRVMYSVSRPSCDFDSVSLPEGNNFKLIGGIKEEDGKKFVTVEEKY